MRDSRLEDIAAITLIITVLYVMISLSKIVFG